MATCSLVLRVDSRCRPQRDLLVAASAGQVRRARFHLQVHLEGDRTHEKHPHFCKPRFVARNPLAFGIRHFVGTVMYTADHFMEKNVSELPPECLDLMTHSQNVVLKELARDFCGTHSKNRR